MKKLLFLSILMAGFVSCEPGENDNEQIHGIWEAISWTRADAETLDESTIVTFEFKVDDTYEAIANEVTQEAGIYRLEGSNLYTTQTGKAEKMINLELPSLDTMVMNMNRSGTKEMIKLVKTE